MSFALKIFTTGKTEETIMVQNVLFYSDLLVTFVVSVVLHNNNGKSTVVNSHHLLDTFAPGSGLPVFTYYLEKHCDPVVRGSYQ